MTEPITLFIILVIGLAMTVLILKDPFLGLAFTIASQPVTDLLPKIPFLTSVVPVIGFVTLVSFMFRASRYNVRGALKFSATHVFALLLITWILVTNPSAAWAGRDRNWVLTLIQLFILLWLAGFLVNTPRKHEILMWCFSATTIITAISAIQAGGFFEEIDPVVRASGLTEGANTAARYFVVAFIFLNYLRNVEKNVVLRLVATIGTLLTFFGVFYTVSRTGIVLLGVAIALLFLLQTKGKYRIQILAITTLTFVLLISFSENILQFLQQILPSITEGKDTMGLRYALWDAGFKMWVDHPVAGVGIGMFPSMLKFYPNASYPLFFSKGLVAHNMYVSMLAETGIIGFILFMAFLFNPLFSQIRVRKHLNPAFKQISTVWLIVFLTILVGGMTKTDQVDKVLWLTVGISVFFSSQTIAWQGNSSSANRENGKSQVSGNGKHT